MGLQTFGKLKKKTDLSQHYCFWQGKFDQKSNISFLRHLHRYGEHDFFNNGFCLFLIFPQAIVVALTTLYTSANRKNP